MTDIASNADVLLQWSVIRDTKPPYALRLRIDKQPANKRELLEALALLYEKSKFAAGYLAKNLDLEELR